MAKLSVIIPYCNEYPQNIFTIRALSEELKGEDFEIISINNYCDEAHNQVFDYHIRREGSIEPEVVHGRRIPDKGPDVIGGSQRACGFNLIHTNYKDKLSHWNAKNVGISIASGDIFYFVDAHVLPSRGDLKRMFRFYSDMWPILNGTISLPLTYKILDSKRQIYKLFLDEDGSVHYKFTRFPGKMLDKDVFEVPCMSCCGVMVSRQILEELGGGWPSLYGIYGGGENFFNFTLRTLGYRAHIYNGKDAQGVLYHHGEKRGYHYEYVDFSRNRAIAAYIIGGEKYLNYFLAKRKVDLASKNMIRKQILENCKSIREDIKTKQKISIVDWLEMAFNKEWIEGNEAEQRFAELKKYFSE